MTERKYTLINALYLFWKKDFFTDVILSWKKTPFRYILFFTIYTSLFLLPFRIQQWDNIVKFLTPITKQIPDLLISKGTIFTNKNLTINHPESKAPLVIIDTSKILTISKKKQPGLFIDKEKIIYRNEFGQKRSIKAETISSNEKIIKPQEILQYRTLYYSVFFFIDFFTNFFTYLLYVVVLTVIVRFTQKKYPYKTLFSLFSISLLPIMLFSALSQYGFIYFFLIIGMILFFITSRNLMKSLQQIELV